MVLRMASRTASKTNSDPKLTSLFLDMLAAEQGAGDNTLDAYRRDLTDFSEFLGRAGQNFAGAAAARAAALLPARSALRHRPARLRTGGTAVVGRASRCPHDRGARQG